MNRIEFIERLEQLLEDIPDSEREEALQYYNDYFEDAGWENEVDVLRELGSPEQVAGKIKAGFADEFSEYSEQGYKDTRFRDSKELMSEKNIQEAENESKRESRNGNIWKILAIILLCIMGLPVILPIGIAVIAVIFAVIVTLAAVVFGLGVAGIGIAAAGIVVLVVGLARIFTVPAAGILAAGVGCLLLAIGIVMTLAILWCGFKIVPALIRGIVNIIRYPFRKAGVIE